MVRIRKRSKTIMKAKKKIEEARAGQNSEAKRNPIKSDINRLPNQWSYLTRVNHGH